MLAFVTPPDVSRYFTSPPVSVGRQAAGATPVDRHRTLPARRRDGHLGRGADEGAQTAIQSDPDGNEFVLRSADTPHAHAV